LYDDEKYKFKIYTMMMKVREKRRSVSSESQLQGGGGARLLHTTRYEI